MLPTGPETVTGAPPGLLRMGRSLQHTWARLCSALATSPAARGCHTCSAIEKLMSVLHATCMPPGDHSRVPCHQMHLACIKAKEMSCSDVHPGDGEAQPVREAETESSILTKQLTGQKPFNKHPP